jgi:hypothetical protein
MISVVEDTLASVEAVVRTQYKQGFRLLDKPKSFYFHDKSSGDIQYSIALNLGYVVRTIANILAIWKHALVWTQDKQGYRLVDKPKSFYFNYKSSGKNAVGYYCIASIWKENLGQAGL